MIVNHRARIKGKRSCKIGSMRTRNSAREAGGIPLAEIWIAVEENRSD